MYRDGVWKDTSVGKNEVDVVASLNEGIQIVIRAGYIYPPCRVLVDGVTIFERTI